MKILIIGGKGMLGQELGKTFAQSHEAHLWDREEIDLTLIKEQKDRVSKLRPDLIINAAAYNDVDGAEKDAKIAEAINGKAVGDLAEVCESCGIPLVHYSSDYVFNGEKKEGYREDDVPEPISAYGYSKFHGEQQAMEKTKRLYLIRLSRMFGRPAASQAGKRSFVDTMLELATKKNELEVVDEELACPTYAPDLAALTRQIVESKKPYGIYHGANSGGATWYDMAKEIFSLREINVKLIPVGAARFPRPARRPKYSILINTKLPQQRTWKEALKEFLDNFQ